MAGAGFFYTGYKDRVKCFSCGLSVDNWMLGDDEQDPRWHKEVCLMMKGGVSGNIPIGAGNLKSIVDKAVISYKNTFCFNSMSYIVT